MRKAGIRTGGQRRRLTPILIGEGLMIAALFAWWYATLGLPAEIFPGPTAVIGGMLELLTSETFASHSLVTLTRIVIAISIAMVLGGGIALLPRYLPVMDVFIQDRLRPFLNSFPSIGWAILGSVWFGVSWTAVIFVQVAILIPFTLINISEGLKELNADEQEMGRSFTRSAWRSFSKITFPALFPYLLTAVRISYGVAWKVSLVAELFGARAGLGTLLLDVQNNNRIDLLFGVCLYIVLFYVIGEKLVLEPLTKAYRARA